MCNAKVMCLDPVFGASAQPLSGNNQDGGLVCIPSFLSQSLGTGSKMEDRWASSFAVAAQAQWGYQNSSSRAARSSSNFRSPEVLLLESFGFTS